MADGQVAHAAGYGILADHGGHGVGQLLREDPSVDNDGRPGRGPRLRDGLVLAIEPMFVDGDPAYVHRTDGWAVAIRDGSIAAHFEHTVAVLDEGPVPLTVPEATGSRSRGQLMQRGPPRPRPSSKPGMVRTSTPSSRRRWLVSTLRS